MTFRHLTALALSALAGAAPGAHAQPTFDGTCTVDGWVETVRGMGVVPAESNSYSGRLRGGCSGTLNGEEVADAPVRARFANKETASSCFSSMGTGGRLELMFKRPGRSRFPLRFRNVAQTIRFEGLEGGTALGYGTAYTRLARQDPDTAAECLSGSVDGFVIEVTLKTIGAISGRSVR
jgi:hypothetical protein